MTTGLNKLYEFSQELEELFSSVKSAVDAEGKKNLAKGLVSRSNATKLIWAYIKNNDLQDENDKRNINCDDVMKTVFGTKKLNMMKIAGGLSSHLNEIE